MSIKHLFNKESLYLSQSILLEEEANPVILKAITIFLSTIVCAFIVWASFMTIDEVSIAPGEIIPIDQVQKVQHIDGGTMDTLLVKEGDMVQVGQILMTLDGKILKSELLQAQTQLSTLIKKQKYLKEELKIRQGLFEKGLNSKISYLNLQKEMSDLNGNIKEKNEIISRYEAKINRLQIKSPIDGIVHHLNLKNIGNVVEPGKTIMEIVPQERALIAEIQISTNDIGHMKKNQKVTLKFKTYDYSRFGGMIEVLDEISPSTMLDPKGKPYFKGIVKLSQNYLKNNLKTFPIIPGMTLDAEIKTGEKTIMEYLLKPVYLSSQRALTER